jgi:CheY-like chemotaxis protein
MPGRLTLFEWDAPAATRRAELLRAEGWTVDVESEDGARGVRNALNHMPDLFLFDLARRASHSREAAAAIRGYKLGRHVTMIFIDGRPEDIAKTQAKIHGALFINSELLVHRLAKLD